MTILKVLTRRQLRPRFHLTKSAKHRVRTQHDLHRSADVGAIPNKTQNTQSQTLKHQKFQPPSRPSRILRGTLYTTLFSVTGFALAWGWKTWSYLQMGRAIGQPETRSKNKQLFGTHIDQSLLVQSLRKDGWIEEDPMDKERYLDHSTFKKSKQGRHLVNEELMNNGHMATKHFRHPTESMTVLVFMADFACESWPNTLHGGIATTVVQDALETHVKNFTGYAPIRNRKTTMNYRLPLHPGTMYSILVQTDGTDYPHQTSDGSDENFMVAGVNFIINEMDRAPRYIERYNETTKVTERVCDIHNSRQGTGPYMKGGSILFLASKHYRDMVDKDQQLIPALQAKLDVWQKAYTHFKSASSG